MYILTWRHLVSLLFASEHKGIYIEQLPIASDYQVWDKLRSNYLVAIKYITLFKETILNYTLHYHNFHTHTARTADIDFPQHIIEARNKLLLESNKEKHQVYICSGKTFNRSTFSNLRVEDFNTMPQLQGAIIPPLSKKFQDYLNMLPPHIFSKILNHVDEALEYINRKHPDGNYVLTEEQRYNYSLYLFSIEERPQPMYVGSRNRNTIRLFELYMGL
jgi:hypothetical protein